MVCHVGNKASLTQELSFRHTRLSNGRNRKSLHDSNTTSKFCDFSYYYKQIARNNTPRDSSLETTSSRSAGRGRVVFVPLAGVLPAVFSVFFFEGSCVVRYFLSRWAAIVFTIAVCGTLASSVSASLLSSENWDGYALGRASPNLDGWEYVTDVASPSWNTLDNRDSAWIGNTSVGDNNYPSSYSGEQFVGMNASYLWQNTGHTYVEGVTYSLSLQATATRAGEGLYLYLADHNPVEGAALGTSLALDFFEVPDTDFGWNEYSTSYTATAADAGKDLVFAVYGRSGTYIDDVSVLSSAPEPSTFALATIGLGLALAGGWRKRRKAAA